MLPLTDAEILEAASPANLRRVVVAIESGDDGFPVVAHAVPPSRAVAVGVVPDVVFVRDDAWSLGARHADRGAACRMWSGEWAAMVDLHTNRIFRFRPALLLSVE